MTGGPAERRRALAVLAALGALTGAVYCRVAGFPFIFYDDSEYVTDNARVLAGLSWRGVRWALGSFEASNWHPLTWLSHMLDVSLFGLEAGGHHLTSLALHVLAALLLFQALRLLTGALWPALATAALFAVHPLHVESVAWVAERKDPLSAVFWMSTLLAYRRYAARPGPGRYLSVAALLALGLTAKPMLVTLPAVLLLLDWWPLGRIGVAGARGAAPAAAGKPGRAALVLLEKVPLLVLAAASSVVTLLAQGRGGAVKSLEEIPFAARAANAVVAGLQYLAKTAWPRDLAVIYPHPGGGWPAWQVAAGAGALLAATAAAALLRHRPHLAVGWLWYLGTLVPVIGLVQVGAQALADRYTYLPLVGIFVAVCWGVAGLAARSPALRRATVAAASIALLAIASACWRQLGYWRGGVPLFEHAVAAAPDNHLALNQLGVALAREARPRESVAAFRRAIAARREYPDPHYNLGLLFDKHGDAGQARAAYLATLRLDPSYLPALNNLGVIDLNGGRPEEALERFRRVLAIDPGNAVARGNLELALRRAREEPGVSP